MLAAAAASLLVAGAWAYANSFDGVLVFDDLISITSNPHIKSLWPLSSSLSAPRDVTVAGRPTAAFTLALNYALAPPDARDALTPPGPGTTAEERERFFRNVRGYHALNLAVHLLAGLALFGVVRRSLRAPALRDRFGADSTLLAWAIALVWIVHPVHTESVTYIVQRVESLMGLFLLLTLYCAIRAAEPGTTQRAWMAGAVVACTLGMGSKETMVVAPLIVAAWDHLLGRRLRWPLYAALAATWTILAVVTAGNPRSGSAGFGLGGWTSWNYLQTQAGVVVHYLRLAVVPTPLVFDYGWPRAESLASIAPQALLLTALVAATAWAIARARPIGFAGAWWFLILAPTSSVLPIPTEVAAEHRLYLPAVSVIALLLLGIYRLTIRRPVAARTTVVAAAIAVACLFGYLTRARNLDYTSTERLMRDTVVKAPSNIRPRVAYGAELLASQRFAEAEAELREALRLEGSDKAHAQAAMYLGAALAAQGRAADGIGQLQQALALDSSLAEAHALLGEAYASRGAYALATSHLATAAAALPDNVPVLRRAAWLLATASDAAARDGSRAATLAERAVKLTDRRDVLALEALMAAYAEQGRFREAAATGREAVAQARAQGLAGFVAGLEQEVALCESGLKLSDRR